jgi:hypothetical protein
MSHRYRGLMMTNFETGKLYKGRYIWEFTKTLDNGLPGFICRGFLVGNGKRFVSAINVPEEAIAVWGYESFQLFNVEVTNA